MARTRAASGEFIASWAGREYCSAIPPNSPLIQGFVFQISSGWEEERAMVTECEPVQTTSLRPGRRLIVPAPILGAGPDSAPTTALLFLLSIRLLLHLAIAMAMAKVQGARSRSDPEAPSEGRFQTLALEAPRGRNPGRTWSGRRQKGQREVPMKGVDENHERRTVVLPRGWPWVKYHPQVLNDHQDVEIVNF